jgi:hypothetical protein
MAEAYTYPCVVYYEADSKRRNEYRIHICFPDFIQAGIPASTVIKNKEEILLTAQDLLRDTLEILAEEEASLPYSTEPLEAITIDRRGYFEKLGDPFRIEIVNISISVLKKKETIVEVEKVREIEEENEEIKSILSGRIQNKKCIISSIGGVPIREGAYSADKLRSLYRAINSEGESMALNFSGKRIELTREQSLMLRDELAMIADELDKSSD